MSSLHRKHMWVVLFKYLEATVSGNLWDTCSGVKRKSKWKYWKTVLEKIYSKKRWKHFNNWLKIKFNIVKIINYNKNKTALDIQSIWESKYIYTLYLYNSQGSRLSVTPRGNRWFQWRYVERLRYYTLVYGSVYQQTGLLINLIKFYTYSMSVTENSYLWYIYFDFVLYLNLSQTTMSVQ